MDSKERVIERRHLGGGRWIVKERRRCVAGLVMRYAADGMKLPHCQRHDPFGWRYDGEHYQHRKGGRAVSVKSAIKGIAVAHPQMADFEIDAATGTGYFTKTIELDFAPLAGVFSIGR